MGAALKGLDAHKLALLNTLAEQHGFHIGLASVECHVSGPSNDMGQSEWGRNRCYYDESDPEDDEISMGHIDSQVMTITNLVDLEGSELADEISTEDIEDCCIPDDLQETVEKGAPDDEEYEGYQGNVRYLSLCSTLFAG